MVEFTASSGAQIVINEAGWPEAKRLRMAVQSELANAGISLSLDKDVGELLSAFLKVDSAKAVDEALWPCLARCTRNGDKITEKMFDEDKTARRDYYDVVIACVKANLFPLYESLYLQLRDFLKAQTKVIKSPS